MTWSAPAAADYQVEHAAEETGPESSPAALLAVLSERLWGAPPRRRRVEVAHRRRVPAVAPASPFAVAWGELAEAVAPVFRLQYLLEQPGEAALLVGTVGRVWHRPRWLHPFFWLLGAVRILFPDVGHSVPAVMLVRVERDGPASAGRGTGAVRHTWYRTFFFPAPRHFDAQLRFDDQLGRIVERVGRSGILEVVWHIRPLSARTIGITTEGMALRAGPLRIWLPRLLHVDVWALERADPVHEDTLHLDLCMTHPLVGPLFGYSGTFQVSQDPSEGAVDGEEEGRW
jgi:hypothetical protein